MSILLEHTVVSAKFDNPEQTMIAVMLADPDKEGEAFEYNIDALDHEHEDYKALVFDCGWDLERIQKETLAINQANYALFRQAMYNEFQDELTRLKRRHQSELANAVKFNKVAESADSFTNIVEYVLLNNSDEDLLFKMKLYVLEKYSTISKSKKTSIRKASTLVELISLLGELIQE